MKIEFLQVSVYQSLRDNDNSWYATLYMRSIHCSLVFLDVRSQYMYKFVLNKPHFSFFRVVWKPHFMISVHQKIKIQNKKAVIFVNCVF